MLLDASASLRRLVGDRLDRRDLWDERCRLERLQLLRARLRQVLSEAKQSRLDPRELRELVEQELSAIEREGN